MITEAYLASAGEVLEIKRRITVPAIVSPRKDVLLRKINVLQINPQNLIIYTHV